MFRTKLENFPKNLRIVSEDTCSLLPVFGYVYDGNESVKMRTLLSRLFNIMGILNPILALGILSYTGSHVRPFNKAVLNITNSIFEIDPLIRLRPRQTACLDEFLGGPLWVFEFEWRQGPTLSSSFAVIPSITIDDLAHLWGPVWVRTANGLPDFVRQIHMVRGHIDIAPIQDLDFARNLLKVTYRHEIVCHWYSGDNSGTSKCQSWQNDVASFIDHHPELWMAWESGDADSWLTMRKDSRLLIAGAEENSWHDLHLNQNCTFSTAANIRRRYNGHLQTAGASESYYQQDGRQISASAGQYIILGAAGHWSLIPGISLKDRILRVGNGKSYRGNVRGNPITVTVRLPAVITAVNPLPPLKFTDLTH